MQNHIPATIYTEGCMNLSYGEADLKNAWRISEARLRHIGLLARSSHFPEEHAAQAKANFQLWMHRHGERGVTPEIDIEVFERFYDETVFRNITTAKGEWEYKLTRKEPGGRLVQIDADGNYLLQTSELGFVSYTVALRPSRSASNRGEEKADLELFDNWARFSHKVNAMGKDAFMARLEKRLRASGLSQVEAEDAAVDFFSWVWDQPDLVQRPTS